MIGNKFHEFQFITSKIIKTFLKFDVQHKPISDVSKPIQLKDISAIVNIVGKFRGLIIISLDKSFCLNEL